MKQIVFFAVLLLGVASSDFGQNKNGTFTGEIMDKQCGQMQSHDNMMKPERATNAKECTLNCVRDGGMFALYDPGTKKVYPIDDGKKVREYAGQRVQITGTYDDNTEILHIKTIAPAR